MHDGADISLAEGMLIFLLHSAQDATKTELVEAEQVCANACIGNVVPGVKTNRAAAAELHIHAQGVERQSGESWG